MNTTSTQSYIDILEKTNQQLSFWYLPYEVAVGFLTIAIAVLTIAFSVILWQQNRDYRKKIEELIREQEKYLRNQLSASSQAITETHLEKLEALATRATGDVRAEKEAAIRIIRDSLSKSGIASTLTKPQVQAIISLLQSFGAQNEVIESVKNVLIGQDAFLPDLSLEKTLTPSQILAIIALLESFGATTLTIRIVKTILERVQK